jgi:transcription antitermination factor NusG
VLRFIGLIGEKARMAWYVVEAFEGKDFEAQLRLAAAGLNVWRPVHRVEIHRHVRVGGYDKRVKVSRNVARFGRYMFLDAELTDAIHQAVKHTPGVNRFLTRAGDERPAEIDSSVIAFLREKPTSNGPQAEVFHKSDRVLFKEGAFAGWEGVVDEVDKRGIPVVTISAFGGTSFPVDPCYLELLVRRQRPKESRDKRRTRRHSIAQAQ